MDFKKEKDNSVWLSEFHLKRLIELSKQFDSVVRELVPKNVENELNGVCVECGNSFIRRVAFQVFCSARCQKKFNNNKRQKRTQQLLGAAPIETKVFNCKLCSKQYEVTEQEMKEPAWYLCMEHRLGHEDYIKLHPELRAPSKDELAALSLVQELDKTEGIYPTEKKQ